MRRRRRIIVLKFGGSVLRTPADIPRVVHEVYRWVRGGWKVVAVVSAFAGQTDALLQEALGYDQADEESARALLASTGELRSASHLALGLDQAGIGVELFDSAAIGLETCGTPLDAEPSQLAIGRVLAALQRQPVLVVPGFIGRDSRRRVTLLGRGGSDCTAIFLAQQLQARCRLVKDVDGLYEWDPQASEIAPRRFRTLPWTAALQLDGSIVQHKAIAAAQAQGQSFEVGTLYSRSASRVGELPSAFGSEKRTDRPLRVAVLGAGTVGRGVLRRLQALPDRFRLVAVGVRQLARHSDVDRGLLVTHLDDLLSREFDVLVDVAGATAVGLAASSEALAAGRAVVTADKRLVAESGAELERLAASQGVEFRYSAAVGGALPALEVVQRLARRKPLVRLDAILNGTTNFVLERLRAGVEFATALQQAQAAGLAERNAARDLNGRDAADKLVLLARAATGRWIRPTDVEAEVWNPGIESAVAGAADGIWRQVASLELSASGLHARVAYRAVPHESPLAACPAAWNVLSATAADGQVVTVRGKGAGRWPTAESVVADLLDIAVARAPRRLGQVPVLNFQPVACSEESV